MDLDLDVKILVKDSQAYVSCRSELSYLLGRLDIKLQQSKVNSYLWLPGFSLSRQLMRAARQKEFLAA